MFWKYWFASLMQALNHVSLRPSVPHWRTIFPCFLCQQNLIVCQKHFPFRTPCMVLHFLSHAWTVVAAMNKDSVRATKQDTICRDLNSVQGCALGRACVAARGASNAQVPSPNFWLWSTTASSRRLDSERCISPYSDSLPFCLSTSPQDFKIWCFFLEWNSRARSPVATHGTGDAVDDGALA